MMEKEDYKDYALKHAERLKGVRSAWELYRDQAYEKDDDYSTGFYNGLDLAMSILEDRELQAKSRPIPQGMSPMVRPSNPKYELHKSICDKLNELYITKNQDYGDSFGRGIAKRGEVSAMTRIEDKIYRLDTLLDKPALVSDESFDDTLFDLANYAIMWLVERRSGRCVTDERPVNVE